MRLYIIRHGETQWNKEKRFQGQTDIPLADKGIELAKKTAIGMKDIHLDYIISSPLTRAIQTAQLVAGNRGISIQTDERIQEISFGDWEGKSSAPGGEIPDEYLKTFYTTPLKCQRPPHGETFQDVCARTKSFMEELMRKSQYEDASILISTHGAASRCLIHSLYEDTDDIWRGCIPPNCAVSIIECKDGVAKLTKQDLLFYDR